MLREQTDKNWQSYQMFGMINHLFGLKQPTISNEFAYSIEMRCEYIKHTYYIRNVGEIVVEIQSAYLSRSLSHLATSYSRIVRLSLICVCVRFYILSSGVVCALFFSLFSNLTSDIQEVFTWNERAWAEKSC